MNRAELLKIAKPILFNTEMVRSILEGRKTVTRRVIKPRYKDDEGGFQVNTNVATGENWVEKMDWDEGSFDEPRYINPPYNTDDILYVRETWKRFDCCCCEGDAHLGRCVNTPDSNDGCYIYKATQKIITGDAHWHPSIHMPKEAARIFLRVTNVRVERLQDISLQDLKNGGVLNRCYECEHIYDYCGDAVTLTQDCRYNSISEYRYLKYDFGLLWDSTIKKSDLAAYGWEANPWVWVIEFERVM